MTHLSRATAVKRPEASHGRPLFEVAKDALTRGFVGASQAGTEPKDTRWSRALDSRMTCLCYLCAHLRRQQGSFLDEVVKNRYSQL